MKTINLLGSTGSIGLNTLEVVRSHPHEYRIAGLAAGSNTDVLTAQIREFLPDAVYVRDSRLVAALKEAVASHKTKIFTSEEGLAAFTEHVDADILVAATTGTSALESVLGSLERGKRVALANKEILVMAGRIVMDALKRSPSARLIPIDSEHSALFQCLQGESNRRPRRILLTGSGGPLKDFAPEAFESVTKETVINHPKWKMGRKISVDSATLMNKGLEIIEAKWLFDVPVDRIEVLIHPEAIVHSMAEFEDGSVIAQMGVTDMRLPIQYALSYPERLTVSKDLRLDFGRHSSLTFQRPDASKFPCLSLAYEAARRCGSAPCVLSAADEVAVQAYLQDAIRFVEIPKLIEKVLSAHRHVAEPGIQDIQTAHEWATEEMRRLCQVY